MKSNGFAAALLMLALAGLVGCAGPSYLQRRQSSLEPLLSSGKWEAAVDNAYPDLWGSDSDSFALRAMLKTYSASIRPVLKDRIYREISTARDIEQFARISRTILHLQFVPGVRPQPSQQLPE